MIGAEPQTQIFLVGQAPQREPYISLFDKLQELTASRQTSVTWVNSNFKQSLVALPVHEATFYDNVTKVKLVSYSNGRRVIEEDPIDFTPLVNEEDRETSRDSIHRAVDSAINPLVIVLPWSYGDPAVALYGSGIGHTTVRFPRIDFASLRFIESILHNNYPVLHLQDPLLNDELTIAVKHEVKRRYVASKQLPVHAALELKESSTKEPHLVMRYRSHDDSRLIDLEALERFALLKSAGMVAALSPSIKPKLTDEEQELVDALRRQADNIRIELGQLRSQRNAELEVSAEQSSAIQAEIEGLQQTRDKALEEIKSLYAGIEEQQFVIDQKIARIERFENESRIKYNCAIDFIVEELEKIQLAEARPRKLKLGNKGPSRKPLLKALKEIIENDCIDLVRAYRVGEPLNTNEAAAMTFIQIAIQKFPIDPRKVDEFSNIRMTPKAVAQLIEDSFEESQAAWLEMVLDRLPEHVRQDYLKILSSTEILQDEDHSTVGRDFTKLIRERKAQSQIEEQTSALLPLATHEATPANGAETRAATVVKEFGNAKVLQLGI